MGENEAVQVMEQVSGFDSVYPKERSISMASAASPIHSWVNCSGIRTSNKSTHSNLLFVRFFFVFAVRFGLAHFALRININVYAGFVLLDQKDF